MINYKEENGMYLKDDVIKEMNDLFGLDFKVDYCGMSGEESLWYKFRNGRVLKIEFYFDGSRCGVFMNDGEDEYEVIEIIKI